MKLRADVNAGQLQLVLRHAAAIARAAPSSDEELLRRLRASRDEAAFAELVNRHGRLVWAVCRNLTRSEADAGDAFQATFLALAQHVGRIRDAARLGSWLHGVAFRVCSKSRLQASRRQTRERAAARGERDRAPPDSAWETAMAAVHDEVQRLPDSLRVPFVLCCLEGVGVTDAAARLGWKLGTLSGRLTRAKQRLMDRLEARGLAIGVISLGLAASVSAALPARLAKQTAGLIQPGSTIPSSIVALSQGVLEMSGIKSKLLAAVVLLAAAGMTIGVRYVGPSSAAAQDKPPLSVPLQPNVPAQDVGRSPGPLLPPMPASPWAFKYEPTSLTTSSPEPMEQARRRIAAHAAAGWEFCGTTEMTLTPDEHQKLASGAKPRAVAAYRVNVYKRAATPRTTRLLGEIVRPTKALTLSDPSAPRDPLLAPQNKLRHDIEAQIKALQRQLHDLDAKDKPVAAALPRLPADGTVTRTFRVKTATLEVVELSQVIQKAAAKKFGDAALRITADMATHSLYLTGSPAVVDWAGKLIASFSE